MHSRLKNSEAIEPSIPEVLLIRKLGRSRREASARQYIKRFGTEKTGLSISHLDDGNNARKNGQAKLVR